VTLPAPLLGELEVPAPSGVEADAGIVEQNRSVYQASHIALYSSYRLPAPPIPALTCELTAEKPPAKHPGRITAIDPDFH
jgi:hypothetical protein